MPYIVKIEASEKKEDMRFAVIHELTDNDGYMTSTTVARTHKKKLANEICFALNNDLIWMQTH